MAVQRTTVPKKDQVQKKFYLINADGKTLGRLASRVATILRGKNKPTYTPHMDTGDHVVIVNAEKIRVTGNKRTDKYYDRFTGYPSGLRRVYFSDMLKKAPAKVLELAIHRMMPKGPLGNQMKKKLYVYAGEKHLHGAQKPEILDF